MTRSTLRLLFLLGVFGITCHSLGDASPQQGCPLPPPVVSREKNIFSEEQEIYLGDIGAEHLAREYRVIEDETVTGLLERIGQRLAAQLPESRFRFRFFLIDAPETTAFAIAGGRIYLTRKLVASVRTEDELAGVLAHEMGHVVARDHGVNYTRVLEKLLGVRQVGDRKDIYDKYHQLIDNARRKPEAWYQNFSEHQAEQVGADRFGVYLAARAGYAPEAFADWWDRFTELKGREGSGLARLFGMDKPEQRRLRAMRQMAAALPPECRGARAAASPDEFQKWQAAVVAYSGLGRRESLPGLVLRRPLQPGLRSDIHTLKFSPDGRYALAEDAASIFILTREPFQLLFRIDADGARPAMFSPDSQSVVFYNDRMQVEKWSIAEERRVSVHLLSSLFGCRESALSPDGLVLMCLDDQMTLALYDVPSGKKFFEKQKFITIYPWSFLWLLQEFAPELVDVLRVELMRKAFSPDGRYLLVASDNDSLAFDLSARTPMKLPDSIKTLLRNRFGFLGSDRLVGVMGRSGEDSRLVRFPSGELLAKLDLGFASVTGATHGDYLILRPVDKYPAGVYDIAARKIPRANRQSALDVYDDYVLSERTVGEIGLYSFSTDRVYGQAKLPPSPFGGLRTVATSPDFKWLAASNRSRGGVWNVASGGRIMHVRGFLGAWFGESAAVYADFPPFLTEEHSIVRLDLAKGGAAPLHRLGDVYARQLGSILLTMRHADPAEEAKEREQREKRRREAAQERERFEAEKRKKQGREAAPREERPPDPEADVPDMPLPPPSRNVRVEARDARTGETLWSRHFPKELPGSFVTESEERLVLLWRVTADQVKEFARENAELQRQLSAWKDKEGDYYLEILEARSGKKLGFLLVETGQSSFRITDVFSAGDWVAVLDSQNRIQLFALSTGERRTVFFGDRIALSAAARRACIENESGKLALYDLDTSAEPAQRGFYVFSNPVSFFQFSWDGCRLFVLTSNQMIYLLDLESASAASAAPAHPQRLP